LHPLKSAAFSRRTPQADISFGRMPAPWHQTNNALQRSVRCGEALRDLADKLRGEENPKMPPR
jgi:hypothetical protein